MGRRSTRTAQATSNRTWSPEVSCRWGSRASCGLGAAACVVLPSQICWDGTRVVKATGTGMLMDVKSVFFQRKTSTITIVKWPTVQDNIGVKLEDILIFTADVWVQMWVVCVFTSTPSPVSGTQIKSIFLKRAPTDSTHPTHWLTHAEHLQSKYWRCWTPSCTNMRAANCTFTWRWSHQRRECSSG